MSYLTGIIKGRVQKGKIDIKLSSICPESGLWQEVSGGGIVPALFRIEERSEGIIEPSTVRIGMGTGIFINDYASLKMTAALMDKIRDNPSWWHLDRTATFFKKGFLGPFRDGFAPGTFFCVDTWSGSPEVAPAKRDNWEYWMISQCLKEAFEEIGLYRDDGKVKFFLDNPRYSKIIQKSQDDAWKINQPDLAPCCRARVVLDKDLPDRINGIPAIITAEPMNGGLQILILATIRLPEGQNFYVRDLERKLYPKETNIPPRSVVMLCQGLVAPLVAFFFFRNEGLRSDFPIISVDGKMMNTFINAKTKSVLKALEWI